MKTKERLQTTLDRLPYGPEGVPENQKVSKKLPEGVRSRELYEDIVRIAGPSFVELLLTQLTSMVDLMMVGSMGGAENLEMGTQALAAVGLTTQPKFLLMAAFVSMNTGVTALVARNRGRGDQEKANLVTRQGLLFTFWATVLMSILGVVFARPMVVFMGSTEETVTIWATQYLQIQMAGFLTMALTSTITASLRAVGDSKTCMVYNMIANGVNVFFNWLLIYGHWGLPEMGLNGAGLSTFTARLAATLVILRVVRHTRRYRPYAQGLRRRGSRALNWRIMSTSLPVMLQNGAEVLIWAFGAVVCGWYGKIELAAYQITNTMSQLGFMAYLSFGIALSIRVANKMGLRDYPGIHLSTRVGVSLNLCLAVVASLIFYFFSRQLLGAFTPDGAVVAVALTLILPLIAYQLFDAVQVTFSNAVRGTGIVWPLLTVSVLSYLIVGVPAMLGLARWAGLQCVGVYWSFVIMLMVAFAAYLHYFRAIMRRSERNR